MYDSLCKFTEDIEKVHTLAKEALLKCDEQIKLCGTTVKEGEHKYNYYAKYPFLCIYTFSEIIFHIFSIWNESPGGGGEGVILWLKGYGFELFYRYIL